MAAGRHAILILSVSIWAAPVSAGAANCEFEAQATQRVVRDRGTGTVTTERAIGRARSQCRQDPSGGRALLESVRRDARQRPPPPSGGDGYRTPILDPAWREGN